MSRSSSGRVGLSPEIREREGGRERERERDRGREGGRGREDHVHTVNMNTHMYMTLLLHVYNTLLMCTHTTHQWWSVVGWYLGRGEGE